MDVKIAMGCHFVPQNYKQQIHIQLIHLVQGSMMVEYTKFYSLATCSEFPWDEDIMIATYCQGLNLSISSGLATRRLYVMADAVQMSYQVEEEQKKKQLQGFFSSSCKS